MAATSTASRADRLAAQRLLDGAKDASDAFGLVAEYARYASVGAEDEGLAEALTDLYNLRYGG